MSNQQNNEETTEHQSNSADDSSRVNIQPSEPEADSAAENEENAPGRTPGKAEGSSEIIEADLDERKN